MIESFLDMWRRFSSSENQEPDSRTSSFQKTSEESFLSALPVVRKIVRRRCPAPFQPAMDATDLEQSIVLRLLDWRQKHREKSEKMTAGDWESFAARAAYNEINRLFTEGTGVETIPLEDIHEAADQRGVEGSANVEIYSLVNQFWQEICNLSLRQRRALLLHSQELILHLLESEIRDGELARALEVTEDEWSDILDQLPLSDVQIADLTRAESNGDGKNIESIAKSIKKARYEARGRLEKLTEK
jgi:hypothetical protein